MDRTERSAREAAESSIAGGSGSGPLNPNDRLVETMERLIKVFGGASEDIGRGGRRRRRKAGDDAEGGSEDDLPGGPGYVNPYILQGLIQNPVGTTKNSLMSMLMGGAGAGIKSPGWLMSMLAGTGGTFAPGAALAAETGWLTAGASGQFMNPALIGAAKFAVPAAAFGGAMLLQHSAAKDRLQDATDFTEDMRWGRGVGMDWRAGVWGNKWQSNSNFYQKDMREIASSMGVGLNGLGGFSAQFGLGDQAKANALNEAAATALNIGVAPGQIGAVLGASVRSGTMSLQNGSGEMTMLLGRIEGWTRETARHGFSSSESLHRMAEISQRGTMGANILTKEAQGTLLSFDQRVRDTLPEALRRGGADAASAGLGADATGDTQRVLMMNQWLGADGDLNEEGQRVASEVLGPDQVAIMRRRYGRMAGTAIAAQLTRTDLGRKRARVGLYQGMAARGWGGPEAMMALGSGDLLQDALSADVALSGVDLFKGVKDLDRAGFGQVRTSSLEEVEETELARLGQVVERLSGLTAETARVMIELGQAATMAKRGLVDLADTARQGAFNVPGAPGLGSLIEFGRGIGEMARRP